jgi:hypothetical protein
MHQRSNVDPSSRKIPHLGHSWLSRKEAPSSCCLQMKVLFPAYRGTQKWSITSAADGRFGRLICVRTHIFTCSSASSYTGHDHTHALCRKSSEESGKRGWQGGWRWRWPQPQNVFRKKPSLKDPGYVSPLLPSERGARSHGGTGNCN